MCLIICNLSKLDQWEGANDGLQSHMVDCMTLFHLSALANSIAVVYTKIVTILCDWSEQAIIDAFLTDKKACANAVLSAYLHCLQPLLLTNCLQPN